MKKKIGIVIGLASVLLITFYFYRNYRLSIRNNVEKLVEEKKVINILAAGSNVYNENRHKFFAIISINPENNNIGITFIPPSYRIFFDEGGKRINRIDEMDFSDFEKIRDSFLKDLKMNIPFFIELYSPDITRVIDLIEGLELFILDHLPGMEDVNFGINYLDGGKIVRYINSVDENSIYIKYDRIQDILFTLYSNKEQKKKFCNIEFISELKRNIKTNFLPQELLKIGEIIYNKGNVISTILPGGFDNKYYIVDDVTYKIYEKEFLTPFIIAKEVEPVVKIKILNGTDIAGLARKMRNIIIRDGLNVVEFGTSPYKKMKDSIIICRKGNYSAVMKVSEITGIDKIYYKIDYSQLYNVLIIIGEDQAR